MRDSLTREERFVFALAYGQEREHLVAARLLLRGDTLVQPLYQYQGHTSAPVIYQGSTTSTARLVAPDMNCWTGTANYFAEVKAKRQWVDFKPAGRGLETGFNWRHFVDYSVIQRRTNVPIWVFFVHEVREPTGVWVGELSQMAPLVRKWNGTRTNGTRATTKAGDDCRATALFPQSALRLRWTLEELYAGAPETTTRAA